MNWILIIESGGVSIIRMNFGRLIVVSNHKNDLEASDEGVFYVCSVSIKGTLAVKSLMGKSSLI